MAEQSEPEIPLAEYRDGAEEDIAYLERRGCKPDSPSKRYWYMANGAGQFTLGMAVEFQREADAALLDAVLPVVKAALGMTSTDTLKHYAAEQETMLRLRALPPAVREQIERLARGAKP